MKEKIFTWTGPAALKLLLIVIILFFARTVQAQDNPALYKEIQLAKKSYTFDELTHVIQQQTGITFAYNASRIHTTRHFRVKTDRMTTVKLLGMIKQRSGIGYRMANPKLIIYTPPVAVHHRPKQMKPVKKKIVKKKALAHNEKKLVVAKSGKATNTTSIENQGNTSEGNVANTSSDSLSPQTVVVIGDSATASGYYSGGGGGGSMGALNMIMRYPGRDADRNPYASLNPPEDNSNDWYKPSSGNPDIAGFLKKNILMDAGISADETYYFSPILHLGFRFLYATLSYNTGAYSQWRYGLGAEARVNDKWSLRVDFTTGKKFSASFAFPTFDTIILPPDSANPQPTPLITEKDVPLTVQSQLSRFSFSVARQFSTNFSLAAGITLNRLKSAYFSEGRPFDLNNIDPPIPDADNRFRTMKPPYVLTQSYNPADATGVKLWLGFQITILYRLSFLGG